jgi:hypothetical protein
MNVRVTTVAGHEVEIPHEEVLRIARSVKMDSYHKGVAEHNVRYHANAMETIRHIAATRGISDVKDCEKDMKELLAHVAGWDPEVADLLVEIMEQRISAHHAEIYAE